MQVTIGHYIEQMEEGVQYKGHVKIDGVRFDFELRLTIPIAELEKMHMSSSAKAHRIFHLTLKKHKSIIPIALDDNEFRFFAYLLFSFVEDMYNDVRTRAINSVVVALSDKIATADKIPQDHGFVAVVSVSKTHVGQCDLTLEDSKMLGAPKFGCKFHG